jgi:hypothetical protein
MRYVKKIILAALALQLIDYTVDRPVILSVDSSFEATV